MAWNIPNCSIELNTPDLYNQVLCAEISAEIDFSMLKYVLFETHVQAWCLIIWQHSRHLIRSHVSKSVLTNIDSNMDLS